MLTRWRRQSKELSAICDDYECGLMQAMITITRTRPLAYMMVLICSLCYNCSTVATSLRHNNRCAEMLAVVRRGPFAKPTSTEQLEYLFTRVSKKDSRKDLENHSLEHVLSFQRRLLAIKKAFLVRGKKTPLGIIEDYWDRTEVALDVAIIPKLNVIFVMFV